MSDNQLAKIKAGNRGVQLATVSDMRETANIIVQSQLAPAGYDTPAKVFVGLQFGAELGLRPMTALSSIAVIKGKPTLYGDAALAQVKKSGLLVEFSEKIVGTGEQMVAQVKSVRKDGECKSTVETEFSVADAKTAHLWGKTGPWKTHPKRMLKYKARAFNLRDNFPDILMGLHLTEEMEGEVAEPMEAPQCDVKPRHDRRKRVVSEQSPPPKDPAEVVTEDDSAGVIEAEVVGDSTQRYIDEGSDMPPMPDTVEAEVVDLNSMFDDLMDKYTTAGGTDFTEWAAEALCRDEDEVDSIEKFDSEMIERLRRHLESEGV